MDGLDQARIEAFIKSLNQKITSSQVAFGLGEFLPNFLIDSFEALHIARSSRPGFGKSF
jgi:hypothetical protein